MRPRQEIARLRREVENLRAQLAAAGVEVVEFPAWALDLTPQEAALMTALIAKAPRAVDLFALAEAMPHRDHVVDYDTDSVRVVIVNIRKKLGFDAIENVWGRGYRAGPVFREACAISRNHAAASARADAQAANA